MHESRLGSLAVVLLGIETTDETWTGSASWMVLLRLCAFPCPEDYTVVVGEVFLLSGNRHWSIGGNLRWQTTLKWCKKKKFWHVNFMWIFIVLFFKHNVPQGLNFLHIQKKVNTTPKFKWPTFFRTAS